MLTKESFEKKCYAAYQLDWMIRHGHTLSDYLNVIKEGMEEIPENDEELTLWTVGAIADEAHEDYFLDSQGFGGSLFACFGEFLNAEFKDEDYMRSLISNMWDSEELLKFYKENYKS